MSGGVLKFCTLEVNIRNLKLSRVAWKNDAVVVVFHFNITYYSQCVRPLDTVPQPHLPIHTLEPKFTKLTMLAAYKVLMKIYGIGCHCPLAC